MHLPRSPGTEAPPNLAELQIVDHLHEQRLINLIWRPLDHGMDVPKMLLRAAFLVVLQLPHDHVFGRGYPDAVFVHLDLLSS